MRKDAPAFDLTRQSEPDMGDYVALDTEDCWKAWKASVARSRAGAPPQDEKDVNVAIKDMRRQMGQCTKCGEMPDECDCSLLACMASLKELERSPTQSTPPQEKKL